MSGGGLYNAVFGVDPMARLVLTVLGIQPNGVPRLRDAWIEIGGGSIQLIVFTRAGGSNRSRLDVGIQYMRSIPGYRSDHDMAFDSTYAEFVYGVPSNYLNVICEEVRKGHGRHDTMEDRWQKFITDAKSAKPSDKTQAVLDEVAKSLAPMFEHLK